MNQKPLTRLNQKTALFVFVLALFLFLNCSQSHQYEDVKTDVQKNEFVFYPDEHSSREPMSMNGSSEFASFRDQWGIVWLACYRETGLGAINSTRVTRVIYLSVIDDQLKSFTDKPITVYKFEGRLDHDIFPTDKGFAIAYVTYDDQYHDKFECAEFDLSQSPIKKNDGFCLFDHASKILHTDSSFADYAMAFHKGDVYAASYDNGMKILRSRGKDLETVLFEIQDTSGIERIKTADLSVDDTGVFLTWSADSWTCQTPECASFYFAYCSFENKGCSKNKMNVSGDSPAELRIKFNKMRDGLVILLQFGNDIWQQKIDPVSHKLAVPTKLLTIASPGQFPVATKLTCTLDECFVFFGQIDGVHSFSTLSGAEKRQDGTIGRAVLCGEKECIQQSSLSGVSFYKGKE